MRHRWLGAHARFCKKRGNFRVTLVPVWCSGRAHKRKAKQLSENGNFARMSNFSTNNIFYFLTNPLDMF